ncbi:MAG: hypothetical protein R3232_05860 [Clostridia bacterium]|nr:hypothetical protein [Clostridia bacterium]
MKKLLVIVLIAALLLLSSCDFIKDRFLDGDPLYGGGHKKGTTYTPSPSPTPSPGE